MAYGVLIAGNGLVSLTHPDEVFYVQTAKEMIAHHSYLVPYIFDQPQFEKPVLTYWLLIFAIKIFGLTDFGARFFMGFFGIIGVVTTYWLAFIMFKSKRTAFLSALVLTSSFIYFVLSRSVLTDMVFSIWVVLSLAAFYWGYSESTRKGRGIVLSFVFAALAVLTKGILGIIFPALIIGSFLAYRRDLKFLSSKATVLGSLVFIALSFPWHIWVIKQYGVSFIQEYWNNVHVRRIVEAEHQKSNTWYFYLLTLAAGIFPWSLLLVPSAVTCYRHIRNSLAGRHEMVFLLFWIVIVVGLMQIAQSKLASYILPVFPAVAIFIGFTLNAMFDTARKKDFRWLVISTCLLAVFFLGAVGFGQYYLMTHAQYGVYAAAAKSLSIALGVYILVLLTAVILRLSQMMIAGHAVVVILLLGAAFFGRHHAEPWVSCKLISHVLKNASPTPATILCSKFYARGVRYYTDYPVAVIDNNGRGFFSPHPVPFLNSDEKILKFLNRQQRLYCIVKKSDLDDIHRLAGDHFQVTTIEVIGGKYLLRVEKI